MAELARIRNFCVIAHVDHGKTTLSDRLLEMTGTVPAREMREQLLDSMELEREHGITIKARAVRMSWTARDGREYELNMIDTPGHVDFTYEVSRSLAACQGAVLLVDASQGIEAQTLANAYLAVEEGLEVIPAINKIDLPNIDIDVVRAELRTTLGFRDDEILLVSGKTGVGVEALLHGVVERVAAPKGDVDAPLRALIFDSHYDAYKGVVAHVRVVDGSLAAGDRIRLMATERESELLELGIFAPDAVPTPRLETGEVGYVATGLKAVADCRVGDTLTLAARPATAPLPGYRPAKPMVFAGFYPSNAEDYPTLKDALEKLRLNDASLVYEPETSQALGFGFRAGFLGLLHLEIIQERLEREYDVDLIATSPSVEYRVITQKGTELAEYRAADLVRLDILVAGTVVDALSIITHRHRAQQSGRVLVAKLRGLIPKQLFDVAIQAAIGGKVIARETVKAKRKDVLAKCYGGDITRKRKLLEKQKEGKRRMKMVGSVEIPQEAFLAVLRIGDES